MVKNARSFPCRKKLTWCETFRALLVRYMILLDDVRKSSKMGPTSSLEMGEAAGAAIFRDLVAMAEMTSMFWDTSLPALRSWSRS